MSRSPIQDGIGQYGSENTSGLEPPLPYNQGLLDWYLNEYDPKHPMKPPAKFGQPDQVASETSDASKTTGKLPYEDTPPTIVDSSVVTKQQQSQDQIIANAGDVAKSGKSSSPEQTEEGGGKEMPEPSEAVAQVKPESESSKTQEATDSKLTTVGAPKSIAGQEQETSEVNDQHGTTKDKREGERETSDCESNGGHPKLKTVGKWILKELLLPIKVIRKGFNTAESIFYCKKAGQDASKQPADNDSSQSGDTTETIRPPEPLPRPCDESTAIEYAKEAFNSPDLTPEQRGQAVQQVYDALKPDRKQFDRVMREAAKGNSDVELFPHDGNDDVAGITDIKFKGRVIWINPGDY